MRPTRNHTCFAMAARRRFVDELGEDASIEADQEAVLPALGASGPTSANTQCDANKTALLSYIYKSQVGCRQRVSTAFGERLVTFADYTASGRSLEGIESFIKQEVRPVYANTHTTASATGMQTTLFRAEARSIVR